MEPVPRTPSGGELALWRSLVSRALRSGVGYEDAQDLASEAVRKALEAHVPERGPFTPFCRTIHANLLKNHRRDRKPMEEFDPETDRRESPPDPLEEITFVEGMEMMRRLSEQILATLDPQEAAFFLALAGAQREAEKIAVTAAARRVGVEPMQGWNFFRRIPRKAREFLEQYESTLEMSAMEAPPAPPESAPLPQSPPMERHARPAPSDSLVLHAAGAATAGYERFAATLGAEERRRLSGLLS